MFCDEHYTVTKVCTQHYDGTEERGINLTLQGGFTEEVIFELGIEGWVSHMQNIVKAWREERLDLEDKELGKWHNQICVLETHQCLYLVAMWIIPIPSFFTVTLTTRALHRFSQEGEDLALNTKGECQRGRRKYEASSYEIRWWGKLKKAEGEQSICRQPVVKVKSMV